MVSGIAELGQKVCIFFLEQRPVQTVRRIAGRYAGRRFHTPDDGWTKEGPTEAVTHLNSGNFYLYDHIEAPGLPNDDTPF